MAKLNHAQPKFHQPVGQVMDIFVSELESGINFINYNWLDRVPGCAES